MSYRPPLNCQVYRFKVDVITKTSRYLIQCARRVSVITFIRCAKVKRFQRLFLHFRKQEYQRASTEQQTSPNRIAKEPQQNSKRASTEQQTSLNRIAKEPQQNSKRASTEQPTSLNVTYAWGRTFVLIIITLMRRCKFQ